MDINGVIYQIMAKKKIEIKTIQETRPYVLWRRCSTQEQGESGLGLSAQLTIAQTFMGKEPVEVFTDVYSGTKLKQCAGLWKAIDYCKEHGYVLVVSKSDRFRSVQDALEVLDSIGERNLIFCDIPVCDRFILTVMWAMWERQAIMGRINTKIALAERKKQIEENGGFFSRSGRWTTHLGRDKGADIRGASIAGGQAVADQAAEWRKESALYIWVENQIYKGRSRKDILAEAAELYEKNPEKYGTRAGRPLSKGILSFWVKEIRG